MILTEEEAKTKRCQESFGPIPQAIVCNSPPVMMAGSVWHGSTGVAPPSPINCIGSACMAWRRLSGRHTDQSDDLALGYCGKAGKP